VERVPYRATELASAYDRVGPLPVFVLLHNVRSLYNVGAFFRTADAVRIERLYLSGITAAPPDRRITKTALGAEQTVPWLRVTSPLATIDALREQRVEITAVETSLHAVDLFDWRPVFPVCVAFGHEVEGLGTDLLERCDIHVRIPMLGLKHSLNVATAGGVVLYELLRKWRQACEAR
jgi:tRNA G18 (ribose-2'-O)-methylase SpoU